MCSYNPKRMQTISNKGQVDRLSEMPNPILTHILSFLPTCEAVQTVVVRRFGKLWTFLPNLDLNDTDLEMRRISAPVEDDDSESGIDHNFFKFASNVVKLHQRPTLDTFKVYINSMFHSDIETANLDQELDSWLKFSLRKQVKVLEFGFGMVEPEEFDCLYKLPFTDFISSSLVELKLEFIEMKLQGRVEMSSLRVLRLIRVTLSSHVLQEINRGCPLLSELEMYNCWDCDEMSFDNAPVEKLKLDTSEYCIWGHRINCPKLKSFEYYGYVDSLESLNLPSLEVLSFKLDAHSIEFKEFDKFKSVLSKLLHTKSVFLSSEFVTVLLHCMMKDNSTISTGWKHVELDIWLTDKHVSALYFLLKNSPFVEKLVLNIVDQHRDFIEPIESELNNQLPEEQASWGSLKHIIIIHSNLSSENALLQRLVAILLKNACVLDELVIRSKSKLETSEGCESVPEPQAALLERFSSFSKASKHAKISMD